MEEAAFLMAVDRIVGRVKIEDDLLRGRRVCLQEDIDEQALDGGALVPNLVITGGRPFRRVFQSVQRALTRDRGTVFAPRLQLPRQNRHHRVMAQLVMVEQILVAKGNAEHPLTHQGPDFMFNQTGHSGIHSVSIEALLGSETSVCCKTTFSESAPRCTYLL